jgi:hypothetical protein
MLGLAKLPRRPRLANARTAWEKEPGLNQGNSPVYQTVTLQGKDEGTGRKTHLPVKDLSKIPLALQSLFRVTEVGMKEREERARIPGPKILGILEVATTHYATTSHVCDRDVYQS